MRRDKSPPILVPLLQCSPDGCWLTANVFGSSELLQGVLTEFFNVVSLLGISVSESVMQWPPLSRTKLMAFQDCCCHHP